eukprot:scaffold7228_cov78-Isochrysis_galbana.AAC.2
MACPDPSPPEAPPTRQWFSASVSRRTAAKIWSFREKVPACRRQTYSGGGIGGAGGISDYLGACPDLREPGKGGGGQWARATQASASRALARTARAASGTRRTSSTGEYAAFGSQHSTMAERGPAKPSGLYTGRRHEPFGQHATSS